jgi:IS30 family transposase
MTSKVKRGPLNKAEIFYIDGNQQTMTAEQIAGDLNRSVTTIKNYIQKNPTKEKKLTAGDQFARQSGATIMTENASMIADQAKSNYNRPRPQCVTKIK